MKISIFGIGYVGIVSAGCLAKEGHTVIGVDLSKNKTDLVNNGISPIVENEIGEIIKKYSKSGALRATTDAVDAIQNSEVSFICVGTPSQPNGNIDLSHVRTVCQNIGSELIKKNDYHLIVVRSTMLPGSIKTTVIPTLEEFSNKKAGKDFGVCINPEFLREGTAVYDYYNPPKTVIGEIDKKAGDIVDQIYSEISGPKIRTDIETAEMVKYVDNTWHALKVVFGNEIGNICKASNIDSHKVMDIFCQDTKLNLSPYYLKPGFAFGGSCLPKDVRALNYKARKNDLHLPIINSINISNQFQIKKGIELITNTNKKKIGFIGFAFKAGTDDLRESPLLEVIETLLGKGYDIRLFDKYVNIAALTGANKDYIFNQIPHISNLMVDSLDTITSFADVIVIGNKHIDGDTIKKHLSMKHIVIDLVRIDKDMITDENYIGICW